MKSQIKSKILLHKEVALEELESFAKEILAFLPRSAVVLLNGNLAAGKTTLVSKIANSLDASSNIVTSPTFSLQQIYGNRVFHYDFYRIDFNDIISLGLLEEFEKDGLHFIEWASDELKDILIEAGFSIYSITIKALESNSRDYKLEVINA